MVVVVPCPSSIALFASNRPRRLFHSKNSGIQYSKWRDKTDEENDIESNVK